MPFKGEQAGKQSPMFPVRGHMLFVCRPASKSTRPQCVCTHWADQESGVRGPLETDTSGLFHPPLDCEMSLDIFGVGS